MSGDKKIFFKKQETVKISFQGLQKQLRRKFKTSGSANGGRTTKWWFVIPGAEDVLIELQNI